MKLLSVDLLESYLNHIGFALILYFVFTGFNVELLSVLDLIPVRNSLYNYQHHNKHDVEVLLPLLRPNSRLYTYELWPELRILDCYESYCVLYTNL